MTVIFDGRDFARKKEDLLKKKVRNLPPSLIPKLVSIIVGKDPASVLYVSLKKKAAERIGCKLLVVSLRSDILKSELKLGIEKYNKEKTVHGIMIQLPLPDSFSKKERDEIVNSISIEKDVDGLSDKSSFLTPTVKAVLEILRQAAMNVDYHPKMKALVVGHSGFEGKKIFKVLRDMDYDVEGADTRTKNLKIKTLKADILVSATGVPDLIKANMIKKGVVLIDVGSPKGDVEKSAYTKASFVSPVPGGVGPVTISCLLENLVKSAQI